MAYNTDIWEHIDRYIDHSDSKKQVLQIGDQCIKEPLRSLLSESRGHTYFSKIGFNCVTVDILGGDRVLKYDLGRKITDIQMFDKFDYIINAGTSEHVEPLSAQYHVFRNMHLCAKTNAILFNFVPKYNACKGHCQIYYTKKFFRNLIKLNDYKLLALLTLRRFKGKEMLVCIIQKTNNRPFTVLKDNLLNNLKFVALKKKKGKYKQVDKLIAKKRGKNKNAK